jgi:hypothetical protein
MAHVCPVCGYDGLQETAYDKDGNPSYEICACCGFEFGFDDESEGASHKEYRQKWLEDGANWFSHDRKPDSWNLQEQLRRIGAVWPPESN